MPILPVAGSRSYMTRKSSTSPLSQLKKTTLPSHQKGRLLCLPGPGAAPLYLPGRGRPGTAGFGPGGSARCVRPGVEAGLCLGEPVHSGN